MTIALVRKLLRDYRWALLAVALLLFGFEMIWVKATQRVTTQMAPMFQAMALKLNKRIEDVEKQFFSGPGRVAQSIIGGDQLKFQRAQDVLSIGYVHPLIQILFCMWAIGRARARFPAKSNAAPWNCCWPSRCRARMSSPRICAWISC